MASLNTYNSNPGISPNIPFYIELVDISGNNQPLTYIDRLGEIVGLQLSINPSNITINMQKIINRTQSMTAWIEDHWGEELDTVSIQGNTASFIYMPENKIGGGISVENRRETASYAEFKNIIGIFNSNGCSFDIKGFVNKRFYVLITYDYSSYMGFFESIDVMEDSANPFRFNYTITFKSERTIYSFGTRGS